MGFLQSPSAIYDTIKWKGYSGELEHSDFVTLLMPVQQLGFQWDAGKTLLRQPKAFDGMINETPWIHARHGHSKRCGFDHNICFNLYRIIPPRCLNCWKVCCGFKTFKQLVACKELQESMNVPSKCGIEVRDYTPKHYGAYWYNDSLDQGYECYERVRKLLDEHVGTEEDGVHCILKRGCTEFEMIKGPSPGWHMTRDEEAMLNLLEGMVEVQSSNNRQRDFVKNHVWFKWMLWAHANGDFSYLPWNDGERLFPDYVTYHDKDPVKMKQELAVTRAYVQNQVPGEKSKAVLKDLFESAKKHNVNPNAIFNMGHDLYTPTNFQATVLENTPEPVRGDHDELT